MPAEKLELADGGGDLAAWLAGPAGLSGKKLQVTRAVGEDSETILQDWLDMGDAELAEQMEAGVLS